MEKPEISNLLISLYIHICVVTILQHKYDELILRRTHEILLFTYFTYINLTSRLRSMLR